MVQILLLQALWGASNPISKYLLGMAPPMFLVAIRMIAAGSILLSLQFISRKDVSIQRTHWRYYAQIIFFGIYIKYIFRYWGLSQLPVTKMSFLLNVTPFFVAIFSYYFFDKRLSKKQWKGLAIGFLGLMPLFMSKDAQEQVWFKLFCISLPEFAILIEIAAHSYALILTHKLIRDLGYSAALTNGVRMFAGGFLALATSLLLEQTPIIQTPSVFIFWLVLLICMSNILCHSLYLHLLRYYSATFLAFTDFLCPVFAAIYGKLFFGEELSWHYLVSGCIVFIGLYLFYQDELKASPSLYLPQFWRIGIKSPTFFT